MAVNILLIDRLSIDAHGDNAFPDQYFEAMGSIQELLGLTAGRE